MKLTRAFGVLLLIFAVILSGCSAESIAEQGAGLLDKIFAGDSSDSKLSIGTAPEPTTSPKPDSDPASDPSGQKPEGTQYPEAVEPSIPADTSSPASQEPPATEPSLPEPSGNITPSHTDATFFGPGESFKYLPKGAEGVYACTYAVEDETIASVDPDTGRVTAVGPGTTKVTMHVECNGQYDFVCIVRCNWEDSGKEPSLPEPTLPADTKKPADTPVSSTDTITASHSDATFFNPKEHFKFLPVGADGAYTCSYATDNAEVASVDEKGVVTAVGPGTTTVTMTVDGGGTEYIFKCIVRCNWTKSE